MGFEPRGIDPGPTSTQGGSALTAFNDIHFTEYVYGDTSGSLLVGMPVFASVLDAGEYNRGLTVPVANSGGIVLLGTTTGATNLICVGVYYSDDANATPAKGTVIRVVDRGIAPVLASAKTGGTSVKVGDILVVDTTPGIYALSNGNTKLTGSTIGVALATAAAITSGASIIAVPGSASTQLLVNARIKLT